METPITVTQRELLSLTPELCAQVADTTVKCRIAWEVAQTILEEAQEPVEEDTYLEDPQLSHMPAMFAATLGDRNSPPTPASTPYTPYQTGKKR